MASTTETIPSESLGVGKIVSESFSIFFQNFVTVMILGFLPMFLGVVASGMLVGWEVALGRSEPSFVDGTGVTAFAISSMLQFGLYGLSIALLVQMAYDAKLRRPFQISQYFGPALSSILPILVLSFVIGILVAFASILLVIPGLWLYAVFSVTVPAIVIERAGFGAMRRSASLTKEFRWPVLGALLLMLICTILLSTVAALIFGIVAAVMGTSAVSIVVSMLLFSALNGLSYGISGISVAMIYARLREIKEGTSVDQLAAVFE